MTNEFTMLPFVIRICFAIRKFVILHFHHILTNIASSSSSAAINFADAWNER
jgi:hypothetical protein